MTPAEYPRNSLDLFPIGNCAASALIDRRGRFVWACHPRPDGEPVFSSLLEPVCGGAEPWGFWSIEGSADAQITQNYLRNTAVLRTEVRAPRGAFEVIDFAPRLRVHGRLHRPPAFFRLVRPLSGAPRLTVRLRPTAAHGERRAGVSVGSNHASYDCGTTRLRLTTNAPISHVTAERAFRLEAPIAFHRVRTNPSPPTCSPTRSACCARPAKTGATGCARCPCRSNGRRR